MLFLLADTSGEAAAGGSILSLAPILLIGVFVYFVMIRPQRKRAAQVENLQESLKVGDDIVTIGGLHGRVDALGEKTVDLDVTGDGDVVMRFRRSAIAEVLRDEPEVDVDEDDEADDEASRPTSETTE